MKEQAMLDRVHVLGGPILAGHQDPSESACFVYHCNGGVDELCEATALLLSAETLLLLRGEEVIGRYRRADVYMVSRRRVCPHGF